VGNIYVRLFDPIFDYSFCFNGSIHSNLKGLENNGKKEELLGMKEIVCTANKGNYLMEWVVK